MREFVSRRYHCAQTTPLHSAGSGGTYLFAICVAGKVATTPMLSICD
jgi:hypothetical protein